MKRFTSLITIIIPLTLSSAVLAEDIVISDPPSTPVASETETAVSQSPNTQVPMHSKHGMGMKHKGKCKHGKGHSGKKHGDKKHGGHHDKAKHDKHDDVVRRLDMIEARMAKIEAMLESLLRR